ncbi:MAG: methyltransferase [Alphaproteobacteria bacterium]
MTEKKEKRLNTVHLQQMVRAYRQSGALMAAIELGLFTTVSAGAENIDAVAKALDIQPLNADRLVTYCLGIGLLEKIDGKLRNAADVEQFLVESQAAYAGPWMLFTKPDWDEWGRLADHLRRKDSPKLLGLHDDFPVEAARAYHAATYSIGMGAGKRFARLVDMSTRKKLIDIGGGSGAYCINAAKKYPHIRAVVLDLPSVVEVAREFIAQNDVADRVEAQVCDFTKDPFPAGADIALMASNQNIYGPDTVRNVIKKAFDALEPGGEMHVVAHLLNADRSGPPEPAQWALGEVVHNSTGRAHSVTEVRGYFDDAGFTDVWDGDFLPDMLEWVRGTKPA